MRKPAWDRELTKWTVWKSDTDRWIVSNPFDTFSDEYRNANRSVWQVRHTTFESAFKNALEVTRNG